ncbi:MAG: glycosyltransferase family 4 protein [Gammaproteobacteria bacterium]|nr:glycosyltransferase family 4 protein [Gammaproteobacteria bacterium]
MKPLSLAIVRQRYTDDGGAERFVARALESLRQQGVGVTLIARKWRGTPGYETLTCNPFYLGRCWRDWSFAHAVRRLTATRQFDLVQSHERIYGCDIYRAGDGVHREWLNLRALTVSPVGRLLNEINPYHRYVLSAECRMFQSAQLRAVICNSAMVRQEIVRHFGVPVEKLHVIRNGVDTDAFHPRLKQQRAEVRARCGIPESATLFLFVGSGFERKGLARALQALARLPDSCRLLVVGRDKSGKHYERQAQTLGIAGRVQFLGVQSDVKPYYGAADALTLPTLYDPFPNVVVEAMASGLPVITSTKCGAAELITPRVNGYVADALDVAQLTEHMRAVAAMIDRAPMAQAARAAVEGLTLESMSRLLIDLYGSLLAEKSAIK